MDEADKRAMDVGNGRRRESVARTGRHCWCLLFRSSSRDKIIALEERR